MHEENPLQRYAHDVEEVLARNEECKFTIGIFMCWPTLFFRALFDGEPGIVDISWINGRKSQRINFIIW